MTTAQQDRAMPTAARIDDLPALFDGLMKLARSGLGITAFGVQVLDLPPSYTTQSHDETATGQEELYVALRGDGAVVTDGSTGTHLTPDVLVVVPPECERALQSGPGGLRVLVVGGTPGAAYEPPAWTETEEAAR
ncbi:MAG TPA: hypothetical protein VH817_22140 [Thermoleophilaceae bacterium]|jgi:hypothetical protein